MKRLLGLIIVGLVVEANLCVGQEQEAEAVSGVRLNYMRRMIETVQVKNSTPNSVAQEFAPKPMLRFGDTTRDAADGALWKLGSGRPQVVVAMEFCRNDGGLLQLNHEFLCLTDERIQLQTSQGWRWAPEKSALSFQTIRGTVPPHKNERIRYGQMKKLARRFSASETYDGETYRLRLMAQPIDQYKVTQDGSTHDGAVFVFAHGTNPEVLLLLESRSDGWQFGVARMCGAKASVKLDSKEVWTVPSMDEIPKSWNLDYTGDAHNVEF